MSAEAGTCYRNSAYRRFLFDHYAQSMSVDHTIEPPQWQGNLLADCMNAQSAAGLNGSLGQLYDPEGTWPGVQAQRVAQKNSQTPHRVEQEGENLSLKGHDGLEFISNATVNVFTAPGIDVMSSSKSDSEFHSMAVPGEIYGQLTETDMQSIIHEAQDRAEVIALQIARDIGWTMPSLISPREQLFHPTVVEFPLVPAPRMTGS